VGPVQSSTERGLCRVRVDGMVRSQLMPGLASSECSAGTPALRRARLEPRLQLCYVRHGSDGQSGLRWDALLRLAAYALADWSGFVCISRDADAHRTGAAIRASMPTTRRHRLPWCADDGRTTDVSLRSLSRALLRTTGGSACTPRTSRAAVLAVGHYVLSIQCRSFAVLT
jgi:hypothetical protein